MDDVVFLTPRQLMERYAVSETTIRRWQKQGILPQPLRIGGLVRWRLADVETHEAFFSGGKPGTETVGE